MASATQASGQASKDMGAAMTQANRTTQTRQIAKTAGMALAMGVLALAGAAQAQDRHWGGHGGGAPAAKAPAPATRPASPPAGGWHGGNAAAPVQTTHAPVAQPAGGWQGHANADQGGWQGHANANQGGWNGGARVGGNQAWHAGGNYNAWSHDWRGDQRYNWRDWRDGNREAFHVGRYYAPYNGYFYRRLSVGYMLDAMFYGSNYWIYDPWSYHLPPAYPPYHWVRYYDDALLVDTYTGQVVETLYDFFW